MDAQPLEKRPRKPTFTENTDKIIRVQRFFLLLEEVGLINQYYSASGAGFVLHKPGMAGLSISHSMYLRRRRCSLKLNRLMDNCSGSFLGRHSLENRLYVQYSQYLRRSMPFVVLLLP